MEQLFNNLEKFIKENEMTKLLKEIRDLLKEILAELKQQKEPTAVTVDSEKRSYTSIFYMLTDKKFHRTNKTKVGQIFFQNQKNVCFYGLMLITMIQIVI